MTTTISLSPTRCIMGAGKFDTDRRYFRANSGSGSFPLPRNETVRIDLDSRYVMSRWTNSVSAIEYRLGGSATGLGDAAATLVII